MCSVLKLRTEVAESTKSGNSPPGRVKFCLRREIFMKQRMGFFFFQVVVKHKDKIPLGINITILVLRLPRKLERAETALF